MWKLHALGGTFAYSDSPSDMLFVVILLWNLLPMIKSVHWSESKIPGPSNPHHIQARKITTQMKFKTRLLLITSLYIVCFIHQDMVSRTYIVLAIYSPKIHQADNCFAHPSILPPKIAVGDSPHWYWSMGAKLFP